MSAPSDLSEFAPARLPRKPSGRALALRWAVVFLLGGGCVLGGSYLFYRAKESGSSNAGSGGSLTRAPAPGDSGWREHPEYVGSKACQSCHRDQFDTYLETSHSRALSRVDPAREPPDGSFDHPLSGRRYRAFREDGRLWHEEMLSVAGREALELTKLPLEYAVGSGHFGKTYLCENEGFLVESPITWYEPRHAWGMSPGYDAPHHSSFGRVVPENCLLCHAGLVETAADTELKMRLVEEAIGCERCHGPGKAHVERQRAGGESSERDDSIVNPRKLSRKLSEAICQQCHLQAEIHVVGRGVRMSDFRPGRPLEPYRCEFRIRKPGSGMTVVGHFEQLAKSACYRGSESLTCITCHDPHGPVAREDRAAHYRTVCLSCHADEACKLPQADRQQRSNNDCVRCHMPGTKTEVPHVAFTHHHIGVHPLKREPSESGRDSLIAVSDLSVLSDSDQKRTLALAGAYLYFRLGPEGQSGGQGQELARRTEAALRKLPEDARDASVEVTRAEFDLARNDPRGALLAARRALDFEGLETGEKVRALVVLATIDFRQGKFEAARDEYRELTRLRLTASDWYQLGMCENKCGDTSRALAALEKASRLDPTSPDPLTALAALHHARHDYRAERGALERLALVNAAAERPKP